MDSNPTILAVVSHGDLENDPAETYVIAAGTTPEASTLTITEDGQTIVSPWPASGLLQHAYSQIGTDVVGALSLDDLTMWYDDEGRLADQPQTNELATKLSGQYGPLVCTIVGRVLITGGVDRNGDTLPLDREQLHQLMAVLDQLRVTPMPRIHPRLTR